MRKLIFILTTGLWLTNLVGQATLRTDEQVSTYAVFPQETIYVHSNSSFFLTGEYLYYKLYCFEGEAGDLTTLSKVAYVELVGKNSPPIFRHKILLQNGQGQGDFFIPTQIASGNYKLIAYTRFMGNKTDQSFYQNDIAIVNPYRSNQSGLQKGPVANADSLIKRESDTLQDKKAAFNKSETIGPLDLTLNDESFGNRSRVVATLKHETENQTLTGNYSFSVRKKDLAMETYEENIAKFFRKIIPSGTHYTPAIGDSVVLPELRGELFHGKVIAVRRNKSVNDLKVASSIPGQDYAVEIARTDAMGNFNFNVSKNYSGDKLVLQVLSQNPEDYEVRIDDLNTIDYSKLVFTEVQLDFSMREEILHRSIHNQVENSFFQFRPDSIMTMPPSHFLDKKERKTYILDDYTRFKTLRETLVEFVQDVSSKRIGQDNFAIRVKGYDYASIVDMRPLILLDGCLIQNHNRLLDFDTRLVEKIDVYRHKLVLGPEIYEGALVLTTKDGDGYESVQNIQSISVVELLKPQTDRKYFVQRYDTIKGNDESPKLPDDRLQLLWIPDLKVAETEFEIDFFTSDVMGEFEIRLEGITDKNEPVYIRKSFVVQ